MGGVVTALIVAIVISMGIKGTSDPKKREARIERREARREARKQKKTEKIYNYHQDGYRKTS